MSLSKILTDFTAAAIRPTVVDGFSTPLFPPDNVLMGYDNPFNTARQMSYPAVAIKPPQSKIKVIGSTYVTRVSFRIAMRQATTERAVWEALEAKARALLHNWEAYGSYTRPSSDADVTPLALGVAVDDVHGVLVEVDITVDCD